jgi:hypothetical protein
MLIFDRRREYDDLASAPRRQCKASRRRIHVCESSKLEAKPPDFDAQPRAMRFISVPRPKGACEERAPWDLSLKSLLETGKGAPWPNEIKLDTWE